MMKKKISEIFYYWQWCFQTRKLRKDIPKYKVLSIQDTISRIIKNKISVSRFGDGEFRLLFPGHYLEFQKNSPEIREKLAAVLKSESENLMVCLPEMFGNYGNFSISTSYWWKKFSNNYGTKLTAFINPDKIYGNSFISRFYMGYKNKSPIHIQKIVSHLKEVWQDQEILIVEGRYSRLGIGNDLFDTAKKIERILCPEKNAFEAYAEILETTKKYGSGKLIMIALGPTATILAHDLANDGFWALDIGHIDVEYMWFKTGATSKEALPGKFVNEATEQNEMAVSEQDHLIYANSIIAEITDSNTEL